MSFKIAILLVCLSATAIKSKENIKKCPTNVKDLCGSNAKCYDDENDDNFKRHRGAYCKCEEGFVGPPPNCRLCVEDKECGPKYFCNKLKDMKCQKRCVSNSCPEDYFCNYQECVPGCNEDYHCDDDEYCHESKTCKKGCRDYFCPEKMVCNFDTRKCIEGCMYHKECHNDEYCSQDSKCQKICDDFPCGDNSVCGLKKGVKRCSCADGYRPVKGKECVKNNANNENLSCDESCGENSKCSQDGDKTFCYCKTDMFKENPLKFCQPDKPMIYYTSKAPHTRNPGTENPISCAAVSCKSG